MVTFARVCTIISVAFTILCLAVTALLKDGPLDAWGPTLIAIALVALAASFCFDRLRYHLERRARNSPRTGRLR